MVIHSQAASDEGFHFNSSKSLYQSWFCDGVQIKPIYKNATMGLILPTSYPYQWQNNKLRYWFSVYFIIYLDDSSSADTKGLLWNLFLHIYSITPVVRDQTIDLKKMNVEQLLWKRRK